MLFPLDHPEVHKARERYDAARKERRVPDVAFDLWYERFQERPRNVFKISRATGHSITIVRKIFDAYFRDLERGEAMYTEEDAEQLSDEAFLVCVPYLAAIVHSARLAGCEVSVVRNSLGRRSRRFLTVNGNRVIISRMHLDKPDNSFTGWLHKRFYEATAVIYVWRNDPRKHHYVFRTDRLPLLGCRGGRQFNFRREVIHRSRGIDPACHRKAWHLLMSD